MNIRVLVVPCDEEEPVYVEGIENYSYLDGQAIVGGLIQPLDIVAKQATIWCNEEGHPLGLSFNVRATTYLYEHAREHIGFNVLLGDCYLTGLPDEEGETQSVPDEVIADFRG